MNFNTIFERCVCSFFLFFSKKRRRHRIISFSAFHIPLRKRKKWRIPNNELRVESIVSFRLKNILLHIHAFFSTFFFSLHILHVYSIWIDYSQAEFFKDFLSLWITDLNSWIWRLNFVENNAENNQSRRHSLASFGESVTLVLTWEFENIWKSCVVFANFIHRSH